jgi:hypothetical protein
MPSNKNWQEREMNDKGNVKIMDNNIYEVCNKIGVNCLIVLESVLEEGKFFT